MGIEHDRAWSKFTRFDKRSVLLTMILFAILFYRSGEVDVSDRFRRSDSCILGETAHVAVVEVRFKNRFGTVRSFLLASSRLDMFGNGIVGLVDRDCPFGSGNRSRSDSRERGRTSRLDMRPWRNSIESSSSRSMPL